MIHEFISVPRQWGKTTYLVERVQQAQDEGAEMVLLVTHDTREAQRWADNVLDWEIDPSRFMVFSVRNVIEGSRGLEVDAVFVDNANLMNPDDLEQLGLIYEIDVATYTPD